MAVASVGCVSVSVCIVLTRALIVESVCLQHWNTLVSSLSPVPGKSGTGYGDETRRPGTLWDQLVSLAGPQLSGCQLL